MARKKGEGKRAPIPDNHPLLQACAAEIGKREGKDYVVFRGQLVEVPPEFEPLLGSWVSKTTRKVKRSAKRLRRKPLRAGQEIVRRGVKEYGAGVKKATGPTLGPSAKKVEHRRERRQKRVGQLEPRLARCWLKKDHERRKAERKGKVKAVTGQFDWRLGRSNARVRHRTNKCIRKNLGCVGDLQECRQAVPSQVYKRIKRDCEKHYRKKYGADWNKAAKASLAVAALAASVAMPFLAGPILIAAVVTSTAASAGQAAMQVQETKEQARTAEHAREREEIALSGARYSWNSWE